MPDHASPNRTLRREQPDKPILCYVTDRLALNAPAGTDATASLLSRIQIAARAGLDWIQLREKDLGTRPLLNLARAAIRNAQFTPPGSPSRAAKIVVNDRLDIAWAASAAGVHLGGSSLPVSVVTPHKLNTGASRFIVGASCHSLEEAVNAAANGCDYIFFGPVFATPSKLTFGPPQGLARLREVCRSVPVPVLAIGGITADNVGACRDAGASGMAAIRLFQQAPDLPDLIAQLLRNR